MKPKRLWIISGVAGSGKSTWVQQRLKVSGGIWISRDMIRFSLIREDEDYFSHENEVFEKFYSTIQKALEQPSLRDIYVDAAHLTKKARTKTLRGLDLKNATEINCVMFDIPVEVAIERNAKRSGRALVPQSVIRDMALHYVHPAADEKFTHIIKVNENGEEREVIYE